MESPSSVGIKTQPSGQGLLAAVSDIQLFVTHTNTTLFKLLSGQAVSVKYLKILIVKHHNQSPRTGHQVSTCRELVFCPRPVNSLRTCGRQHWSQCSPGLLAASKTTCMIRSPFPLPKWEGGLTMFKIL